MGHNCHSKVEMSYPVNNNSSYPVKISSPNTAILDEGKDSTGIVHSMSVNIVSM